MTTTQKSLRIRRETLKAIEEMRREREVDFSTLANELLEEAARMRRCPGIVFAYGPTGRRARVAGTGIDVWEVIATFRSLKGNIRRLRKAYPHLAQFQLLAALNYYRHFKDEIDRRIASNAAWTSARTRERHAFAAGELP